MKKRLELEGFKLCPYCPPETRILEENFEDHIRAHENEEMRREQETLSVQEEAKVALEAISMAISAEELRLKQTYKYKIPKSIENLSPEEVSKEKAKELIIRKAMTDYVKVSVGEEEFNPKKWYVAPEVEFNPKDYIFGQNIFKIKHYTKEHIEETKKKLGTEAPTSDMATSVMRGELDEEMPKPVEKVVENLGKFDLATEVESMKKLYEDLCKELADVKEDSPNLNGIIFMNLGRQIFEKGKCPMDECGYKPPKELSKAQKNEALFKHFGDEHLAKIKGKVSLAVVKRVILPLIEEQDAFLKPKKLPRAEGYFSPNPESCSRKIVYSLTRKYTKDKEEKVLEKLTKKDVKADPLEKAIEAKSSKARRKNLQEKE